MANFVKNRFQGSIYVQYQGRFVARFKVKRDRAHFINFLCSNFTTEEYFGMLDQGYTPVGALETKGYVSTTVKRILRDHGYPETLAGRDQYLTDQRSLRKAA
jgi:hypothetical protein